MKYLFYVLVVINLVFLIWKIGLQERTSFLQEQRDQHIAISPSTSIPSGELDPDFPVSPDEPEPEGLSVPETPDLPDTASRRGCFEIGPIETREIAENYLALLYPIAKEARVVIRAGDVPDGWWVIYPKASTPEAARANRQMLLNKGIYETWLFDKGPLEGAISMGLYKTPGEAELAVQSFREKGITAKTAPRQVRGDVYWVKIPWSQLPLLLDEAVQTLNSQDPTLKMPSPAPCEGKPEESAGHSPSR
jgi:hypothetical protein